MQPRTLAIRDSGGLPKAVKRSVPGIVRRGFQLLCLLGIFGVRLASLGGDRLEDPEGRWLIQNWQTEDGLPENSATSIVQTSDGYLWFGTFNGLVRFDGVTFNVYNRANTPDLPDNGIANLHLDAKGRLWISTLRGLVVRQSDGWSRIRPEDGQEVGPVRTFAERPKGEMLLTLFDGPIFQWVSNRLDRLPAPPGRQNRGYLGLADATGAWWVVQDGFVGQWDSGRWRSMMDLGSLAPAGVVATLPSATVAGAGSVPGVASTVSRLVVPSGSMTTRT